MRLACRVILSRNVERATAILAGWCTEIHELATIGTNLENHATRIAAFKPRVSSLRIGAAKLGQQYDQ
jgi:hypothetical protein